MQSGDARAVNLHEGDWQDETMNADAVFDIHPAILRFERTIRYLTDTEITGFFSEEGATILILHAVDTGSRYFSVIPKEMEERIRGSILTHNHPSGCSFTKRDLKEASFFSLKEIRVVGRTGLYSMMPGAGGWPVPQVIADCFSAIEKDPDFQAEIVCLCPRPERFTDAGGQGSCIERIRSDRLCERVAAALNLTYRRYIWKDANDSVLQA